jgi:alkyl sulfatase BDS1-like metallo-beta-lactamase superfamily hydrolase
MKTMNSIQLKELTFDEAIESRDLKLTGNKAFFDGFLGMLDNFNFWFNIVTP